MSNNTIIIKIDNLDEKAHLYFQYQNQSNPQPAYIELDCRGNGELMADYSGEIGNAVPMYYWHRLAIRWAVEPQVGGHSLQALFQDENFLSICQRIVDGFEEVWNGSNFVGSYNEDAEAAIEEAQQMIERDLELCEVWNVDEWLFSNCSLADHWDTQPIAEAVAVLESCVESNQLIDGDLEDALIKKAKEMLDYSPEELNSNHITELVKRGEITENQSAEWREEYQA